MNRQEGAGSVLAVGLVAAVVAVLLLVAPLAVLLEASHRAASAADAAALAAGDTALGLAAGIPCERARQVAEAGAGRLASCRQRGDIVRVRVLVDVLGISAGADAVAGPAGG